ncbi:YncE family protein, partial [Planctomycetota bacterium]
MNSRSLIGKSKSVKWGMLCLLASVWLSVGASAGGKSLFTVADVRSELTRVRAFGMDPNGAVHLQKEGVIPFWGDGGREIAVDSEEGVLFVSSLSSNRVQLVDSITLQSIGDIEIVGATNLAGLAYDHKKSRLYAIERGTDKLFVHTWNSQWHTLTPIVGSPIRLAGTTGHGLALDEVEGILYVANGSPVIVGYRTDIWYKVRTITLSRT